MGQRSLSAEQPAAEAETGAGTGLSSAPLSGGFTKETAKTIRKGEICETAAIAGE